MNEGYIKFNIKFTKSQIKIDIKRMIYWRNILYSKGLIGAYSNGIGFGNISQRTVKNQFIISGTSTGSIKEITQDSFSIVKEYNFKKNFVNCLGPIKASSESMSHASIYENISDVNAIIHIHNIKMWKKYKDILPTTRKEAKYGTPEMAEEINRIIKETDVKNKKIFITSGHREGIFGFGKNIDEAAKLILNYFEKE